MKKISDDDFLNKQGWKKVKGYKIDLEKLEDLSDEHDYVYISDLTGWVDECEYWTDEDECCYEDVDELLQDCFEEFLDQDGNLYDEPVQDLKPHKPKVSKSHNNQQDKRSEVSGNSSQS